MNFVWIAAMCGFCALVGISAAIGNQRDPRHGKQPQRVKAQSCATAGQHH